MYAHKLTYYMYPQVCIHVMYMYMYMMYMTCDVCIDLLIIVRFELSGGNAWMQGLRQRTRTNRAPVCMRKWMLQVVNL